MRESKFRDYDYSTYYETKYDKEYDIEEGDRSYHIDLANGRFIKKRKRRLSIIGSALLVISATTYFLVFYNFVVFSLLMILASTVSAVMIAKAFNNSFKLESVKQYQKAYKINNMFKRLSSENQKEYSKYLNLYLLSLTGKENLSKERAQKIYEIIEHYMEPIQEDRILTEIDSKYENIKIEEEILNEIRK